MEALPRRLWIPFIILEANLANWMIAINSGQAKLLLTKCKDKWPKAKNLENTTYLTANDDCKDDLLSPDL